MVKIPYVPCYQVHILLNERDKNCDPVEILILILGTFGDETYFTKYTSFFCPVNLYSRTAWKDVTLFFPCDPFLSPPAIEDPYLPATS